MLGWGSFFFQKIGKRELMRITRKEEKEMMGAILGDIIGSPYEFDNGNKSKNFPLFCRQSTYTDDTVMSVAVCRAFLDVKRKVDDFPSEVKSEGKLGISDDWILQNLADRMREFGRIFPYAGYGGCFLSGSEVPICKLITVTATVLQCVCPRWPGSMMIWRASGMPQGFQQK